MSEPLLGEAAIARSQSAPRGDGGRGDVDNAASPFDAGGLDLASGQGPGAHEAVADLGELASPGKARRRRRGSRGGRGRHGSAAADGSAPEATGEADEDAEGPVADAGGRELGPLAAQAPVARAVGPSTLGTTLDGSPAPEASPPATVKPRIGDTRPGSPPVPRRRGRAANAAATGDPLVVPDPAASGLTDEDGNDEGARDRPRRQRRRRDRADTAALSTVLPSGQAGVPAPPGPERGGRRNSATGAITGAARDGQQAEGADGATPAQVARGRAAVPGRLPETGSRRANGERRSRPLGRYLMVVHVGPTATQIAVLEGRTLIEHYVSRPADDATQIDGNIYLGRVQNVLPGMEAAFVDIGTPKNAVLYRGDLRYDDDEVGPAGDDDSKPTRGRLGGAARDARIEQLLRTGQNIICQVTKNPIGTKGARLTQEVSLPGRFVVLIPESDTYGISKRLGDDERKRLRKILDDIRPAGHGLIVRTAAEGASAEELGRDVARLMRQWDSVQQLARSSRAPQLLYREPDLAVRVIREEFNRDYRGVVIDDAHLYEQVKEYVTSITPELADRVELVDPREEPLPLFERFRVHEQVHKALDRKVWLPSGGSLIIERTEALTVIDVNTGKNVGTSNLEETVFRNNLEAAEEIARQLRLRDIGGIIVIDFIDMEVMANRAEVIRTFREALARDKTRSQVFDISELGLVEMTRKRISEGLVESYSETCPTCAGRGIIFDESLL
ncbi:MAG TPA: Rne/Rng family ribonuclease [Acidimicrobiales bacterium]|nr:Rne/Rng family ribonuclease [Acidimicrobiales bacterium]